jgi:glycosyltransferase involved in cell wall biosynthesis
MLISIIIPCRKIDDFTRRCVWYCTALPEDKEIIVVPDEVCPGLPATKRNWAIEKAKGEILAFIDSDAYPSRDWLTNALVHLPMFAGVCGPGVLPPDAPISEQGADLVYRLLPYSYRVTPEEQRIVPEFPTFNLIVWKDKAPKFKSYLTGEDSLFCRELKGNILYDPSILVYHNRRPLFKSFSRQVSTYGYHRGLLIGMALGGILITCYCYITNFICGFFTCRTATHSKGNEKKE